MGLYGFNEAQFLGEGTTLIADRPWIVVGMVREDCFGAAGFEGYLVGRVNQIGDTTRQGLDYFSGWFAA